MEGTLERIFNQDYMSGGIESDKGITANTLFMNAYTGKMEG